MKLAQAEMILTPHIQKPFSTFCTTEQLHRLRSNNKGAIGHIIEETLGLAKSSALLDCEDGEIKAHPVSETGHAKDTAAMGMTGPIDNLFNHEPFEQSRISQKIKRTLFVGICKPQKDKPEDWFIHDIKLVDWSTPAYSEIWKQIHIDYDGICTTLRKEFDHNPDARLHSTHGPALQIRPKASGQPGNYSKPFSELYGRDVCDKTYGYFLRRDVLNKIHQVPPRNKRKPK